MQNLVAVLKGNIKRILSSELILFFGLVVVGAVIIQNAWVSDDAFITFRTVDNFLNGFGLRWNVAERVQSYTHPLWMFLLFVLTFIFNDIYYVSIFLSVLLALGAVFVLLKLAVSKKNALIILILAIFSKSFIDFSTSGLETPLAYLLLTLFWLIEFKTKLTTKKIYFLGLVASMVALTRLDLLLLLLPAIVINLRKLPDFSLVSKMRLVFISFLPLIIWELFSLYYYGFLFPNTAFAKLDAGIPLISVIVQGFLYFIVTFEQDPLMILAIIFVFQLYLFSLKKQNSTLILGMLFYTIYVIWIGGDFMSGRFILPVFVSGLIFLSRQKEILHHFWRQIAISLLLLGILNPKAPPYQNVKASGPITSEDFGYGIMDEKRYYIRETGLFNYYPNLNQNPYRNAGLSLSEQNKPARTKTVGMLGYFAGPRIYIIDQYGLSDPLLARMDTVSVNKWRPGHLERSIPCGYAKTVATGQNQLCDENLKLFYDKLSLITRGQLLSKERLSTIVSMNLGLYNKLIKQ